MILTPTSRKVTFALSTQAVVTGPLDEPEVRARTQSLARHGAVALVGNLVVPGPGLLAPFIQRGTRGDPCREAALEYLASTSENEATPEADE